MMSPRIAASSILVLISLAADPSEAKPRRASCAGERATLVGTRNDDVLKGTARRDVIVGGRGGDVLRGLGGNDLLCGGRGNDDVAGGTGDDILESGRGVDGLFGEDGDDRMRGGSGDGDILLGGSGNDELDGGSGLWDAALYVFASSGVEAELGGTASGDGMDSLVGLEEVVGSDLDDSLTGGEADEILSGGLGNDVLAGGGGNDQLSGGPGDDQLDGGAGPDYARYFTTQVGIVADLTTGRATGDGDDTLTGISNVIGTSFDDSLTGDSEPNFLAGREGTDTIEGRDGDDTLSGGDGDNTLDGGEGDDTCEGGPTIENCEGPRFGISPEPEFLAQILTLKEGETLDASAGIRLAGYAFNGSFGTGVLDAQVAVRHLSPRGCRWWSHDSARLVASPCEDPEWNSARFRSKEGRGGAWSFQVGPLQPGWYEARLLVVMDAKNGGRPADRVGFRVS